MRGLFNRWSQRSQGARSLPARRRTQLRLETLEARVLLTFTPIQIRHAYGLDAVTLYDTDGNPVTGDGTGQTIAIVDAYREPNIASDLAYFDAYYGLPDPPSFTEIYAQGTPAGNSSWGLEIALDVEYAHAMAPGADMLLVDAQTNSSSNLYGAEDVARNYPGVSVVSNSWGSTESSGSFSADFHFTTPAGHNGVTFFAASGDTGGQKIYPAMSPNVVSVGGTNLILSGGEYFSESGWSGSGGGQSAYASEPAYQYDIQSSGKRWGPDVAMAGGSGGAVFVYDTYGSYHGFVSVYGTSASSPMFAGVIAIANQQMNLFGYDTLDGRSQTLPGLYGLAVSNNYPYYDGQDFHDIMTGSAGGNAAGLGYDKVTGLGTPIAYNLIPDLVSYLTCCGPSGAAAPQASVAPTSGDSAAVGSSLLHGTADAAPDTTSLVMATARDTSAASAVSELPSAVASFGNDSSANPDMEQTEVRSESAPHSFSWLAHNGKEGDTWLQGDDQDGNGDLPQDLI